MDTEIDWQTELDTAFGSGPDAPPGHYVAAGHRAVRRRRVRLSVIGVAATVLLAGGVWSLSPGDAPRGAEAPVATQGPAPTTYTTVEERRAERRRTLAELRKASNAQIDFLGNPAALTDHGLVLAPQTSTVLERVRNPMGYTPNQGSSMAVRAIYQGREQYSLMSLFPDGASTTTVDASGDFPGWLAQAVDSQQGLDAANGVTAPTGEMTSDQWLVLGPEGRILAANDRIEVVENRTDVDLGEVFARGTDRGGVARLLVDGTPAFVAYAVSDGALTVTPGGGTFASLDAFIDWARGQYASGEGMR